MKLSKLLNPLLVASTYLGSLLAYSSLPSQMPSHWNLLGQVDSYSPKSFAAWFLPALVTLVLVLFKVTPNLDPKKKKYKLFRKEWEIIQTGIIGFFVYLHFAIFYISLHPQVQMMPLMFIGLGSLFVLIGNYLSKIRQNYFIGIKLPWTLSDEDNWNKTHRFASWCFVIAGIATLIEACLFWYAPIVVFGGIILASVLPMIYSYLLYAKVAWKMKYVLVILALLMAGIFTLRLLSGEDDWVCVQGEWQQHGHPDSPMPAVECRK